MAFKNGPFGISEQDIFEIYYLEIEITMCKATQMVEPKPNDKNYEVNNLVDRLEQHAYQLDASMVS